VPGLFHICGITSNLRCPKVLRFTPIQGQLNHPTGLSVTYTV